MKAVDDVSFNVRKDEILGIAGESACGKTTLALALIRLLKPPGYIEEGEILLNGVNILRLNEKDFREIRWKQISYVPQSAMNSLNPVMRIEEQINDAMESHGFKDVEKKKIKELLTSVRLSPEIASTYPHELSGGMRQRVIIAMAVALGPQLVIADEPTTALDVVIQRGILQMLSDIRQRFGSSVIMITHDMAAHAEIVDRLAIMYAGKIVEIGSVSEIFKDSLHPYTQALISAIPSVRKRKSFIYLSGLPPDLRNPPPGCRFHSRCDKFIRGKCDIEEPKMINVGKDRFVQCHLHG